MTADEARLVGQEALIWLAGQEEAMAGLFGASGLAPEDLRARASDPELLGFLLEFILGSDEMVLDFARSRGLDPTLPGRARAALPGGSALNWT